MTRLSINFSLKFMLTFYESVKYRKIKFINHSKNGTKFATKEIRLNFNKPYSCP